MVGSATRAPGGSVACPASRATLTAHGCCRCVTQVALVVFAVHTLVAKDNAMDAEKAFVTLTVLNILNKAQAFLPFSIHSVVQVRPGRRACWRSLAGVCWIRQSARHQQGRQQEDTVKQSRERGGTGRRCPQTSSKHGASEPHRYRKATGNPCKTSFWFPFPTKQFYSISPPLLSLLPLCLLGHDENEATGA